MDLIKNFSDLLGTNESALRLLLTVFAGYPLAAIYRCLIYGKQPKLQHFYFILMGFSLGFWNYGYDIFHTILAILITFSTLKLIGGTKISVALVFCFNLTYLITGYMIVGTENYDINWTMPQCILVLRLIGVAFDMYDGQQIFENLSKDSQKVALKECPQLLEFTGHMLFPASFLVGPQFSLKRYQNFVNGKFENFESSKMAALKRFSIGIFYLVLFQLLGIFVNDQFMFSEEFKQFGYVWRLFILGIWGRFTLYKYISCWLLTEGACILFGITYNGKDSETGDTLWNGLENIKLSIFENTTQFNDYIKSFNVNTNQWVGQYIYKRLKFLNNRHISQLGALLFLAIWHGLHSGYYVCFFYEFLIIYVERDVKSLVNSNEKLRNFFINNDNTIIKLFINILLRLYTFILMGWCLIPFALLTYNRYLLAFNNVVHIGNILYCLWPILYAPILRHFFRSDNNKNVKQH